MALRRVFTDANVLWSPQQRNLILQIAFEDHIAVHWTDEVIREWLRNIDDAQRAKSKKGTLPLMARLFPTALIGAGDDRPIGRTEAKDRHVALAAASIAPSVLLTWNLRDFDREALRALTVDLLTPDELLAALFDETPELIFEIAKAAQQNLTRSAPTWDAYLAVLERNRLNRFVARLRSGPVSARAGKVSATNPDTSCLG